MTIKELSAVLALGGTIIGGWVWLDTRHAHDGDVKELAGYVGDRFQQTTVQFMEIRLDSLRQRLWYLRERTGCQGAVAAECRWLEDQIERIKREMARQRR